MANPYEETEKGAAPAAPSSSTGNPYALTEDPNRAPIKDHTYDMSFAKPAVETILGGSPLAGLAAGMDTDQTVQGRLADYQIGVLGKLFYWLDRPYTAVISAIDAAWRQESIAENALKGFTGKREASMINLLENAGADPDKTSTQLLGVGLDVVAGTYLDPTNWISFGAKAPISALSKVGRVNTAVEYMKKIGYFSEATQKQLAGLDTLAKRRELAERGLWGMNVKLPYMPVIGKPLEKLLSTTDIGKQLTREGIVVTPTYLNVQAAKSMDAIGNWLAPANDAIRKVVGGTRYWAERHGLTDLAEWTATNKTKYMQDAFYHQTEMMQLAETVPVETRRNKTAMNAFLEKQFHALEDPGLINATEPVMGNRVRKLTPEEISKAAENRMKLAKAETATMDEFNRGMQAEMAGLRDSVKGWAESRKRLTTVSLDELTEFVGREKGSENVGTYADEIWNDLPRLEADLSAYLSWRGEIPSIEQLGEVPERALFKAVLGDEKDITEVMGRGPRPPSWIPIAYKKRWLAGELPDEDLIDAMRANFKATPEQVKRYERDLDEFRKAPPPSPRPATQADIDRARIRKYKESKGEEFDFGTEFAHQYGRNPRFLVQLPETSTLSGEFKHLGGLEGVADLELRKARVLSIADGLDEYARNGGDTFDLVSNYMKSIDESADDAERFAARKKYTAAARKVQVNVQKKVKKGGVESTEWVRESASPDNRSFQQILEAVYWRRVSNSFVPGYYTMNARKLAEDLEIGEIFSDDPVARYWAQHESLRRELDQLNQKLARAEVGDIPKAEFVPPDYLDQDELASMMERLDHRDHMRMKIAEIDEETARILAEDDFDWSTGQTKEPLDPEVKKETLAKLATDRFMAELSIADETNPPIREIEARYKQELINRRDEVKRTLEGQSTIDRAFFTEEMIRRQLKKQKPGGGRTPALVKEATETEALHLSPEEKEFYDRLKPLRDEAVTRIEKRVQQYEEGFKMPYEDYMPHFWHVGGSIVDRLKQRRQVGAWKRNRAAEIQSQYPQSSIASIKAMVEREALEHFGVRDVRLTREEAKGNYDRFKHRKYDATVREMKASDFPINWNTDAVKAVNAMYTNAQKWEFHVDMVEELIRRGMARQFFPGTDPADMARHLGGKAVPLQAEGVFSMMKDQSNNPFLNLWVNEDVKKFYDQQLMGASMNVLGDGAMQKALDVINAVRRWGSAWTLLPFPSFYLRNFPSDVLRAMQNGMSVDFTDPRVLKNFQLGAQFSWPRSDNIGNYLPPPMRKGRMIKHGIEDEVNELRRKFGDSANSLTIDYLNRYMHANVMDFHIRDTEKYEAVTSEGLPSGRKRDRLMSAMKRSIPFGNPNTNPMINFMTKYLGNTSQNLTRVTAWFDAVHKYADTGLVTMDQAFKAASDTVRQSQFDYADLTPVEQNLFKNVNWFYTYLSKSLPYQFKKFVTDPKTVAPYYRAYMGFWNGYEKDFEPEDTREFITQQLGVPIMDGVDPETGETRVQMWSPTNWVGVADLNEAADWVRSFATGDTDGMLKAFGMNINPIAKSALERFLTVDTLTGQRVDENEYSDVFGISMSQPTARLIRNVRLINEIDRLNPGGVWTEIAKWRGDIVDKRAHRNEAPEPARWMQFMFGWRLFEATPVKDVERNLRDQMRDFENARSTAKGAMVDGNMREFRENVEIMTMKAIEAKLTKARLDRWVEDTKRNKVEKAIQIGNE